MLQAVKLLEDVVTDIHGFNSCCWAMWGGSYDSIERKGVVGTKIDIKVDLEADVPPASDVDSDGGWTVPSGKSLINASKKRLTVDADRDVVRSKTLNRMQGQAYLHWSVSDIHGRSLARTLLAPLIEPVPPDALRMTAYLPYSRRRITAVIDPEETGQEQNSHRHSRLILRTTIAPWTGEERWKPHQAVQTDEGEPLISDETRSLRYDTEVPSEVEPLTFDIWMEKEKIDAVSPLLVGAGLRGRWAKIGTAPDDQNGWWIFKPRDCELCLRRMRVHS